jgi:preprotein translocase subunit SecG
MNYLGISKIIQLVLSAVISFLVLIQNKGTGLSSAFGGGGAQYRTRRGVEKVVFVATIISGFLLVANSLVLVLLS